MIRGIIYMDVKRMLISWKEVGGLRETWLEFQTHTQTIYGIVHKATSHHLAVTYEHTSTFWILYPCPSLLILSKYFLWWLSFVNSILYMLSYNITVQKYLVFSHEKLFERVLSPNVNSVWLNYPLTTILMVLRSAYIMK